MLLPVSTVRRHDGICASARLLVMLAVFVVPGRDAVGASEDSDPLPQERSTWYFAGTITETDDLYTQPIEDRRYQLGMYDVGNRVSGSITFRRIDNGPDYQSTQNPDPDAPDDPNVGVYYQVVESLDFSSSMAGWPGESIVSISPPPGPDNPSGVSRFGSAEIRYREQIATNFLSDSITMIGPAYRDEVFFEMEPPFQQVVIKRNGWDAIPGTQSAVFPFLFARDTRLNELPDMLDGDHMRIEVPDVSLPSVFAQLFVDMVQVPFDGQRFRITAQLDYLSDAPLPAPVLELIPAPGVEGHLGLDFTGFVMESDDLERWTPVDPQPESPWLVPIDGERRFFKALR